MKDLSAIIAAITLISISGCKTSFTQVQAGYAQQAPSPAGPQICGRVRQGGEAAWYGEWRSGPDVCYNKFPDKTSTSEYSLTVPVVEEQVTVKVEETTSHDQIKISWPLEYKLASAEKNFSGSTPSENQPTDLELAFWVGVGINLDINAKSRDYLFDGRPVNDIPGLSLKPQIYGELTAEFLLYGLVAISGGLRYDHKGTFDPALYAGPHIRWK